MGIAPGPALAGHRELALDRLVVLLEVAVADGPVGADAVLAPGAEVRGVEAGRVACEVHHRAAYTVTAVVLAKLDRILAPDHAGLRPVESVRAGLVADPIAVRVPETP